MTYTNDDDDIEKKILSVENCVGFKNLHELHKFIYKTKDEEKKQS
jgi:hypothetical protein